MTTRPHVGGSPCAVAPAPAPGRLLALAVGVMAVLLLSGVPVLPGPAEGFHGSSPAVASSWWGFASSPHVPAHLGLGPGRTLPQATGTWYTQEGSTLSVLNGSVTTGVAALAETIPLVVSPHSTGYELNGLSDTGDWYQIVVADNWPGCNSGFEEVLEVWNNIQGSGPVTCDPTVSLSSGDLVRLALSFDAAHDVCLALSDLSTQKSHAVCQAQPDAGGSRFDFLSSAANSNGYYSGTMTETVNLVSTTCPDYTDLPRVQFDFPRDFFVTGYVPWSDEWELGGAGTSCYTSAGLSTSIAASDPTSQYVDTASGTSYGPHWEDGQNYSYLNASVGFRFETDPNPLTGVALTGPGSPVPRNTSFNLTSSTSGGVSPYQALWALNGSLLGLGPTTRTFRESSPGTYAFTAFGVDHQGDVVGPSSAVDVRVPANLVAGAVTASPNPTSADVGQSVTFHVGSSGGIFPLSYVWTGLPTGCTGANASSLTCVPASPGNFSVSVTVSDANGSVSSSPALAFRIYPTLAVQLLPSGNATDVGLPVNWTVLPSGGSGNLSYTWFGLPSGCGGSGPFVACRPNAPGTYGVSVLATDSDAAWVRSASLPLRVAPQPSVALSASPGTIDAGQNVTLSAVVTGGTPGFLYSWVDLSLACSAGNAPTVVCATAAGGTLVVSVSVLDAVGGATTSPTVTVEVHARPSVAIGASVASVPLGGSVNLSAQVSGGAPPLTYAWSGLPPGCVAADAVRLSCQPQVTGSFSVHLRVTDGAGVSATTNRTLSVLASSSPGGGPGSGALFGLPLWVVGLAAAVAIVGVVIAARARRQKGARAPEPSDAYA